MQATKDFLIRDLKQTEILLSHEQPQELTDVDAEVKKERYEAAGIAESNEPV
jgi:hypothetical protein